MPLWRPAFPGSFREEREVETAITPRGFPRKERCCRCARRSDRLPRKTRSPAPRSSRPTLQSRVRQRAAVRNAEAIRGQVGGQGAPAAIGPVVFGIASRFGRQADDDAAVLCAGPSGRFGRLAFRAPARGGSNPDRPYVGPLIVCGRFTPPSGRPFNPRPRQRARHSRLILPQPGRSSRQDGTGFTKPDRDARVRYGGAKTGDNRGDADPAPTPSDTQNGPSTTIRPASSRRMKIAIGAAGHGIGLNVGRRPCRTEPPPSALPVLRPGQRRGAGGTSSGPGEKPHAGSPAAGPPCGGDDGPRKGIGQLEAGGCGRGKAGCDSPARWGRQAVGRRGKDWPKWFLTKTRVACYGGLCGRIRPARNEAARDSGPIPPPSPAGLRSVKRLRAVAEPPCATSRLPASLPFASSISRV